LIDLTATFEQIKEKSNTMKTNLLLLLSGFLIFTLQAQDTKWKGKSVDFLVAG